MLLTGCTEAIRGAGGPAVAYPNAESTSAYGGMVSVAYGIGTSDGRSFGVLEMHTRALFAPKTQSAIVGLGPYTSQWAGRFLFDAAFHPGFGAEGQGEKGFVLAGLGGEAGVGYALESTEEVRPGWRIWATGMPTRNHILRKRTILSLRLAGNGDARFTREPLWSAGLLAGLSFVTENFDVDPPSVTPDAIMQPP